MTSHHATAQRRASITMIAFVLALVCAVALVVYDGVAGLLEVDLEPTEVLGDCVERVGATTAPCEP